MRKSFFITLLIILSSTAALAQDTTKTNQKKFMQITTIESVMAGGSGRSKMIITNPDGSQKESDMDNLFSIAGINFKNIKSNEARIVSTLKDYAESGWTIEQATSLTVSPNDNGSAGMFMTRYLLSKNE